MKKIVALSMVVVFAIILISCGSSNESSLMKIPENLKEEIQNQLSAEEQNILKTFVAELITSFNQRTPTTKTVVEGVLEVVSSETYFNKTSGYDAAAKKLREAKNNNEVLETAANYAFIIEAEALLGSTTSESSTPEDVIKDIEKNINSLIQYYYD